MQKSIVDCKTGQSVLVDMTQDEEDALTAQWVASPTKAPVKSTEDRLAALEAAILVKR